MTFLKPIIISEPCAFLETLINIRPFL